MDEHMNPKYFNNIILLSINLALQRDKQLVSVRLYKYLGNQHTKLISLNIYIDW